MGLVTPLCACAFKHVVTESHIPKSENSSTLFYPLLHNVWKEDLFH